MRDWGCFKKGSWREIAGMVGGTSLGRGRDNERKGGGFVGLEKHESARNRCRLGELDGGVEKKWEQGVRGWEGLGSEVLRDSRDDSRG